MYHPRLYLDENVHSGVAPGLRRRGFDVLTTVDAGRTGTSDEEQLRFAISQGRCLFTFNRGHFAHLHDVLLSEDEHHWGIIVSRQVGVGSVVRMLSAFLATRSAEELQDQLFWLSPRST